jgi:hypothetical protein
MSNTAFEYDVALSFAREDRDTAEEFANLLSEKNISVFHDEYAQDLADLWGRDVVDHLVNLCARKARYCVLLISRHYPLKAWTGAERTDVQERALRDADEHIIPIRLDDVRVPGIEAAPGYRDLRKHSVVSIVEWLGQKLRTAKEETRLPSRSHDLRSGHVPSTNAKPDE